MDQRAPTHLLVWSDLHLEHTPFAPPKLSDLAHAPHALLLAGDTDKHGRHVDAMRAYAQRYGCPVIAIDGNHEPFFQVMEDQEEAADRAAEAARAAGDGVHILRGTAHMIGQVRVVGATLWTDFHLYGTPEESKAVATREVNDHRLIATRQGPFTPDVSSARHAREKAQVLAHLRVPHAGPTVVMTHHMPRPELNMAEFEGNPRTPAFASDLRADLEGLCFDAWIYGHTHGSDHGRFWHDPEGRAYVFNARGDRDPNPHFDPTFLLTL